MYLLHLQLLDVRHNHLVDVPVSLADLLMRRPPLVLLLSFNPLTGMNDLGFQEGAASAFDDLFSQPVAESSRGKGARAGQSPQ